MINKDYKMPIVLVGNTFKYEIEATVKLFIPASKFSFSYEISDACGECYIIAGLSENNGSSEIYTEVKINESTPLHLKNTLKCTVETDKSCVEHELCRLVYNAL